MNHLSTTDSGDILTGIVSVTVKRGCEAEYEAWAQKISTEAEKFEGYLGVTILRPPSGSLSEYVTIYKFNGYTNLQRWMDSSIRQQLLEECQPLFHKSHSQVLSGMQSWFSLPQSPANSPPKYKMAAILWLAVSSLLFVIPPALTLLLGAWLPKVMLQLLVSAIMVTLMTYFVMPLLTKLFAKWLYR